MPSRAVSLPYGRGSSRFDGSRTVVPLVLMAVGAGVLVPIKPLLAVGLVLGVTVVLAVAATPAALPVVLVASMFVESLSVGGLHIQRVTGALALAAIGYYLLARGTAGLRPNALLVVVGGYGFWTFLSYYWAGWPSAVGGVFFSYLLAVTYMLAIAVLVRTPRHVAATFATLAVGSLIFGLIAFVTYKSSSDTARASGLQGDPNYFAVFQVVAFAPTLALAAAERRPGRRLTYYAIAGVIILSVVSSLSRTGLLALVAVLLTTVFLPWKQFFRTRAQKGRYVVALFIASAVAVGIGSTAFVQRAQTILDPGGATGDRGSGRTDIWNAALHGYRAHPWLGIGAGNFDKESIQLFQTTPGVDTRREYTQQSKVVHNAYIETLTELGPVGLALFVAIFFYTARLLLSTYRRADRTGARTLARSTLAVLVSLGGTAVSAVFLSDQLSKVLWILVGLALALDVMTQSLPIPRRPAEIDV